jgi:hypothetical protein
VPFRKYFIEITFVVVTDRFRDLVDRGIGRKKQRFSAAQAQKL